MYKDYEFEPTLLTKSLMAALFVGIFAVLADEAYNFAYRAATSFMPSQIINVSSLIFATLIVFMIAGMIYFFMAKSMSKPGLPFIVVMLLLTAGWVFTAITANRSSDPAVNTAFHGLYTGVALIMGVMAAFLIPYFVKNYRIFL